MPKVKQTSTRKQAGASVQGKGTRTTCGLCARLRSMCACSFPSPVVSIAGRPRPVPRTTSALPNAEVAAATATGIDQVAVAAAVGRLTAAAGTAAEIDVSSSGRSDPGITSRPQVDSILPSTPANLSTPALIPAPPARAAPLTSPGLTSDDENIGTNMNPMNQRTPLSSTSSAPQLSVMATSDVASITGVEHIEKQNQAADDEEAEAEEQEDEDLEDTDDIDGEDNDLVNEKACRQLWLSTEDALAHVKSRTKWAYVVDEKKRQRVIREKYWRLVKQACIFSNRTGVHVLLAVGRTERVARGLKEHVFASEELCKPSNKCLNETANSVVDTWTKGMSAYRELLIARNKEQEVLLRQHQARFLADQESLKEKDKALQASLANAAILQEELDRLRAAAGQATAVPT
ncbi:hypothetical protein A4X13_0g8495 [Tilletia indica]|uniref:Uncharacterized protein n=1 Tax=Tilletia indica TaxID=43049 RepID=A0A177TT27_9BASI|nr:hypothetical protein A4X13_0g8495 [Tilletia indica]